MIQKLFNFLEGEAGGGGGGWGDESKLIGLRTVLTL